MALLPANPLAGPKIHNLNTASQPLPSRPWSAPQLLCLWHLASFDAPAVAVVWACAFAWIARVHLEWWVPLLLACGTWSVYVADRLLDARTALRTGSAKALRERHRFHWRYRRALIPLACGAAALAVTLVAQRMPIVARERNSIVAVAALIYFSGVHSALNISRRLRAIFSKELLVGLIFTAGCAAPALSRMHFTFSRISSEWPFLVCLAFFAALAWVNCSAIETWELVGPRASALPRTAALSIAGILIAGALSHSSLRASALTGAAAVSAILLMTLDYWRNKISPLALRTLADVVLLVPALLIVLAPAARHA